MKRSEATNLRFLADGRRRAREGRERFIEEEVRFRYAERIARAGFIERWRIEAAIRDEVRRRLDEVAPPGALY